MNSANNHTDKDKRNDIIATIVFIVLSILWLVGCILFALWQFIGQ